MTVRRLVSMLLGLAVLLAPLSPTVHVCLAAEGAPAHEQESGGLDDYLDKWVLNGNAIGGALGATLGQYLGTMLFPGPIGWVAGSLILGLVGGIIGNLIDNQIHNAYNYAAFDRPPIEDGGLVLEDAGAWEQALYQTDLWVVSGGGIASLVAHFGVNLLAPFIPGGLGRFLGSYVGIFLFDAFFGTIGDNVDGLIDGGKIGAEIDEVLEKRRGGGSPSSPSAFVAQADGRSPADAPDRRQAYRDWLEHVEDGTDRTPEGRAAYQRYMATSD